MVIDDNTLLQTDATVIAGILVLLTIYTLRPRHSPESREKWIMDHTQTIVMGSVVPFCVSAIIILNNASPGLAVAFTTVGFIYLVVGILAIILIPRLPIQEKTETGK
jgi:hypothetical protein